ncbi:hypothetical protein AAY473_040342 [Plecturocebus cupreus]
MPVLMGHDGSFQEHVSLLLFWKTKELRDLFLLLFFCCFKVISFHKDERTCLHALYGGKEFPEREDKDGLCCKSSPRLKTGELHMQLAREPETTNILSGRVDNGSLCRGHQSHWTEILGSKTMMFSVQTVK